LFHFRGWDTLAREGRRLWWLCAGVQAMPPISSGLRRDHPARLEPSRGISELADSLARLKTEVFDRL
jgi:hypothetical protein